MFLVRSPMLSSGWDPLQESSVESEYSFHTLQNQNLTLTDQEIREIFNIFSLQQEKCNFVKKKRKFSCELFLVPEPVFSLNDL